MKLNKRQQEYNAELLKECSFKPTLFPNQKYNRFLNKGEETTYDRLINWQKAVDTKVSEMKEENVQNFKNECTFAPDVSPEQKNYLKGYKNLEKNINKKAIDKYLERMIITRLKEEEKQRQEYHKCGSGNHWNDDYTIPKVPKLSKSDPSKSTHNI